MDTCSEKSVVLYGVDSIEKFRCIQTNVDCHHRHDYESYGYYMVGHHTCMVKVSAVCRRWPYLSYNGLICVFSANLAPVLRVVLYQYYGGTIVPYYP